jgi:NADPH2:quinone reductase
LFFVGSDDVPPETKSEAAQDINRALEAGWQGFDIAQRFSLDDIAKAHEFVEHPSRPGRVLVII